MRWLWFASLTLTCALVAVFLRQPLILIGELLLIDLFITHRIRLILHLPKTRLRFPVWLNLIIWLAVTTSIIRVLAIDSLSVGSANLKPILQPGDNILISKLTYGPRLPLSGYRLTGLSAVHRGDLLAYHFPEGDSVVDGMESISYYALSRKWELQGDRPEGVHITCRPLALRYPEISRCAGLPGDTILITSAGGLTDELQQTGRGDYNIFPHDARYPWNRDNFGPVIVPKNGDSIRLTLQNLCLYERIIEVYEKNNLDIRDGTIFLNGSPADTYVFRMDYYFVLGDNRLYSRDSRHWGFLPEDHLIGKPVLIWFSVTGQGIKPFRIYWNRILKPV